MKKYVVKVLQNIWLFKFCSGQLIRTYTVIPLCYNTSVLPKPDKVA